MKPGFVYCLTACTFAEKVIILQVRVYALMLFADFK